MLLRNIIFIGLVSVLFTAHIAEAKTFKVSQKGRKFHPSKLIVEVGDTVQFVNDDRIVHNVFSRSKVKRFDIDAQRPGEAAEVMFESPGVVLVRCAIHPKMQMKIRVIDKK